MFLTGSHLAFAQNAGKEVVSRGVVRPYHDVRIAADIVARVRSLHFRQGERFKRGQTLVEFDCDRYRADLRAAESVQNEQEAVLRNTTTLRRHMAAGAQELEIARARRDKAEADADSIRERMRACRIDAPFDGKIVERLIDEHEMPQANAPLLRIMDDTRKEIAVIVPSSWLRWIKPGMTFDFKIDELGATMQARVERLGAAVDATSQTIEIFASFAADHQEVRPGMSGSAIFVSQDKSG
jgi:RND family efflux transporter MFP subunit